MKKAFTLAEVLITLGVIGVVVAITVPSLIQNYNKKTWNSAAVVFERKLENALKTMNSQSSLASFSTTEEFIEELSHHFKVNKICQNDELLDCFSETIYWGGKDATSEKIDMKIIKTSRNFGQSDWKTNIVGVLFANGVSALIAYNPTDSCEQDPHSNQIDGNKCLALLYDTSANKNPNTFGKDLRANYNVTNLGTGCAFIVGNTCYSTQPFKPSYISKEECEELREELGINACSYEKDYWAGAVKTCGGVSNIPTLTQLAEMANLIYGKTDIGDRTNHTDLSRNDDLALSLGFKFNSGESLYIWASDFHHSISNRALVRIFAPSSTTFGNLIKEYNLPLAICINKD